MDNLKFIDSFSFKDDTFPPFKKQEVHFWWEKSVQDNINFYLSNKYKNNKNYLNNSKRFKINIVLGNNWWWKSRLFEKMLLDNSSDIFTDKKIILDDFFILWVQSYNENNVNKYLFDLFSNSNSTEYLFNWYNNFFNWVLLFNYFFEKVHEKSLIDEFIDNKLSKKYIFWEGWELSDLTKVFRHKFLWKRYEDYKNSDFFEEQSFSNTFWKYDNYKWLIDIILRLDSIVKPKKNNINSYILLLIISRFKSCTYRKNSIIDHYINNTEWKNNRTDLDEHIKKYRKLNKDYFDNILNIIDKDNFNDWEHLIESFLNYLLEIFKVNEFTESEQISFINFVANDIFYLINIRFNNDINYSFTNLSSWEKLSFLRIINIYMKIIKEYNNWTWKKDFIILIDEPDLHLHLEWQKKYIQKLVDIFHLLPLDINIHFIIATHSPFLISDLPNNSIVIVNSENKLKNTFWANYIDIINNWFFFENNNLIWSFSEKIIWQIANQERRKILKDEYKENLEQEINIELVEKIKKQIWDKFLVNNLLYFKSENNEKN